MTTIYNFSNINLALEDSEIIGVKKIGAAVYVRRDCWYEAFKEIQELCACRFLLRLVANNTGLPNEDLIRYDGEPSEVVPAREGRYSLLFRMVKITMRSDHEHHTPGDDDDIRTIPLAAKHVLRINQLLTVSNYRKVLNEMEGSPACYRRPCYEDIRNI
ncbi:unnamed protein product [Absidia cylindrospora]